MPCKHTAIRCTNNRFFCLLCGAEIEPPRTEKPPEGAAQAATDGNATKPRRPKNPAKDTAKDTAKKEEKNANG